VHAAAAGRRVAGRGLQAAGCRLQAACFGGLGALGHAPRSESRLACFSSLSCRKKRRQSGSGARTSCSCPTLPKRGLARAKETRTWHIGLQPGHVGLQPGHVGLQPGHVGLQPGHVGLQPGHIGLAGT